MREEASGQHAHVRRALIEAIRRVQPAIVPKALLLRLARLRCELFGMRRLLFHLILVTADLIEQILLAALPGSRYRVAFCGLTIAMAR